MSFGQNFAYSKTKEYDVALMLAANVSLTPFFIEYFLTRFTLEPKTAQTSWNLISTNATMKEFI